ncbi:unnamed protein product [[Actinomadura] parvosata subsp. kistnae]|nr:unnamed protein product [Actinomadura parvosata subsp. kistnae]
MCVSSVTSKRAPDWSRAKGVMLTSTAPAWTVLVRVGDVPDERAASHQIRATARSRDRITVITTAGRRIRRGMSDLR